MERGARSLSGAIPDVLFSALRSALCFLVSPIDIPLTVNNAGKELVDLLLALLALAIY
jgi:hypothetical protein